MSERRDVVIVGAGFAGLTAALELARAGRSVTIVESESTPGGLAGTFEFAGGVRIEKFYHHWFTHDHYVNQLVETLGLVDQVVRLPSRTGMYYAGTLWRLTTPLDLLRFKPLSLVDRFRLGLLVFRVHAVRDWKAIEHLSIREWLEPICGRRAYEVVWEPLIRSKFSIHADNVSAVWFWKKLALRGSTRNRKGGEEVAYYRGGFGRLADELTAALARSGGEIRYNTRASGVRIVDGNVDSVETNAGTVSGRQFVFTPAFPIIADIFRGAASAEWIERLRRVRYLGNICLVLMLKRSLSDTYWLNVNDPGFPFVGVIEHTNLDSPENYGGNRIVFVSRYLSVEDEAWRFSDDEYLKSALLHLKRMFPQLDEDWVIDYRIWRADYAQPVTERNYSSYVPGPSTPYSNATITTMAQIYPEDRGTNYAIREGMAVAARLSERLS